MSQLSVAGTPLPPHVVAQGPYQGDPYNPPPYGPDPGGWSAPPPELQPDVYANPDPNFGVDPWIYTSPIPGSPQFPGPIDGNPDPWIYTSPIPGSPQFPGPVDGPTAPPPMVPKEDTSGIDSLSFADYVTQPTRMFVGSAVLSGALGGGMAALRHGTALQIGRAAGVNAALVLGTAAGAGLLVAASRPGDGDSLKARYGVAAAAVTGGTALAWLSRTGGTSALPRLALASAIAGVGAYMGAGVGNRIEAKARVGLI